jgi:hypothetical protein
MRRHKKLGQLDGVLSYPRPIKVTQRSGTVETGLDQDHGSSLEDDDEEDVDIGGASEDDEEDFDDWQHDDMGDSSSEDNLVPDVAMYAEIIRDIEATKEAVREQNEKLRKRKIHR